MTVGLNMPVGSRSDDIGRAHWASLSPNILARGQKTSTMWGYIGAQGFSSPFLRVQVPNNHILQSVLPDPQVPDYWEHGPSGNFGGLQLQSSVDSSALAGLVVFRVTQRVHVGIWDILGP